MNTSADQIRDRRFPLVEDREDARARVIGRAVDGLPGVYFWEVTGASPQDVLNALSDIECPKNQPAPAFMHFAVPEEAPNGFLRWRSCCLSSDTYPTRETKSQILQKFSEYRAEAAA
jgi:hypothetical protein